MLFIVFIINLLVFLAVFI